MILFFCHQNFPIDSTNPILNHILSPGYNSSESRTDRNTESVTANLTSPITSDPVISPMTRMTSSLDNIDNNSTSSNNDTSSNDDNEKSSAPSETVVKVVNLTAIHPCYPKGQLLNDVSRSEDFNLIQFDMPIIMTLILFHHSS